jgi:hypothetical protein
MKRSFALIAACLALAGNAHAVDAYLFGYSNNSTVYNKLSINDIETRVVNAGWYGDTGLHDVSKGADYLVGTCSSCAEEGLPGEYHNWFIVDLKDFTGLTPTTTDTVTLTLSPFYVTTAGTFKLWDYLGDIDDLPDDTPADDPDGIAIYKDLGMGKPYGSFEYLGTEIATSYQTITLSADAIYDLNAAISIARNGGETQWAIGGSFAPTAPIPEPETYALMLAGLGLVGWMAKRRKA